MKAEDIDRALTDFYPAIRTAAKAAAEAGRVAQWSDRGAKTKAGEGHRSIVTAGDHGAEKILVEKILRDFPQSKILSEEDADNPNMLKKDDPAGLFEAPLAFIIDPIDGTAPYGSFLGTWCVSAGVMVNGNLFGGAVYAPDLNGGMLVVAQDGLGGNIYDGPQSEMWQRRNWLEPLEDKDNQSTDPKKATVFFGVDSMLYKSMTDLMPTIAANVRVTGIANSGILALAQVACGRITAVVQTPQKAWDWAGAYRAVLETGRIFSFFRLVPDTENPGADKLVEVGENKYDFKAFKYEKVNRLGYVAGEPEMVRRLMALLPRKGWARTNPENVSGAWK
ncbi:MAG: inositol monophosphatase family protein [Patescibacteria group bacterium]